MGKLQKRIEKKSSQNGSNGHGSEPSADVRDRIVPSAMAIGSKIDLIGDEKAEIKVLWENMQRLKMALAECELERQNLDDRRSQIIKAIVDLDQTTRAKSMAIAIGHGIDPKGASGSWNLNFESGAFVRTG